MSLWRSDKPAPVEASAAERSAAAENRCIACKVAGEPMTTTDLASYGPHPVCADVVACRRRAEAAQIYCRTSISAKG